MKRFPIERCPICSAEAQKERASVPLKVLEIDGVPQTSGTVLMIKPSVAKKLETLVKQSKEKT